MKSIVLWVGGCDDCKSRVAGLYFSESSTRTSISFQVAMQRLGGSVVVLNEAHSSVQKGETFEDTVATLTCYCDVIILRHPEAGIIQRATDICFKPIINAGDGTGEHPTQALLDAYTIYCELGRVGGTDKDNPMVVTLVGDLRNGRTVHSLVPLLARFVHLRILWVSPPGLELPGEIVEEYGAALDLRPSTLDEAISRTDVLYVTRIQKERFANPEEYAAVQGSYRVDAALMAKAKARMVVMHPLPRTGEIAEEVDRDPRAAYFRQMENGLYVRMAILSVMLSGK